MGENKAIAEEIELVTTKDNLERTPSTSEDSTCDWLWHDLAERRPSCIVRGHQEVEDTKGSPGKTLDMAPIKCSPKGFDFGWTMAIQDSGSLPPGGENVFTKPENPPSISNLSPPGFDPSSIDSEVYPSYSDIILDPLVPNSSESDSPIVTINNSMSEAERHTTKLSSEIPNTGSHIEDHLIVRKPRYTDSVFSTGGKSSHSSKLSINSLRRRLGFQYSESYLGDIISLMQHVLHHIKWKDRTKV
jgi:hypothetical protein